MYKKKTCIHACAHVCVSTSVVGNTGGCLERDDAGGLGFRLMLGV